MKQVFLITLCMFLVLARVQLEPAFTPGQDWVRVSKSSPEDQITLHFAIRHGMEDVLEGHLYAVSDPKSPEYGNHLTREQVRDLIDVPDETIGTLHEFLDLSGVPSEARRLSFTRDFLTVSMSIQNAEHLLNARFHVYKQRSTGAKVHRAVEGYTVPDKMAELVDFVGGIGRFPRPMSVMGSDAQSGDAATADPAFLHEAYHIPASARGGMSKRNNQAVIEFLDQYYSEDDLRKYEQQFGLDREQLTRVIGPNKPSQPGGEASLDVQVMVAIAPRIPTLFLSFAGLRDNDAPPSDANQEPFLAWLLSLNELSDSDIPLVQSVSYGDDESSLSAAFLKRANAEFIKCGLRGVTIVVASGDDGAGGTGLRTSPCTRFHAEFPASSPYVVSVGGTQIFKNEDGTLDEVVSDTANSAVITTGGGFSDAFGQPSYQKEAVKAYLKSGKVPTAYPFNHEGRAYPDVAAMANAYPIYLDGVVQMIGGTSASAPMVAGMIALFNEERMLNGKSPLGFFNPLLYSLYSTDSSLVRDIVSGNNACSAYKFKCCIEGYEATQGWDAVSGLGALLYEETLPRLFE